jgi:hypothetical protein
LQMPTLWEGERCCSLTLNVTLLAGVYEAGGFGTA